MNGYLERHLPLTKRSLRRIAYGRRLRNICALIGAECAFVIALYGLSRLDIPGAIGTFAVLLIYPLWFLCATLSLQRRPLSAALRYDRFDSELQGAMLAPRNGCWQYANGDWFVCVSDSQSAALRAEWIDFTIPVHIRIRYLGIAGGGPKYGSGGHELHSAEYVFAAKDGSALRARIRFKADIEAWIAKHGGRTA